MSSNDVKFSRKLASNDKKVRDKTIKVLSVWLSKQHNISETDLLKLWKGLFYCMWMCDKPKVQRELAARLANMLHAFPGDRGILFAKTFFATMLREWHGIDRLRLDKFYGLIRSFLEQCFVYMANRAWSDEAVDAMLDVLTASDGPLSVTNTNKAPGVVFHVCDIYLESLMRALEPTPEVDGAVLEKLLEPFFALLANATDKRVRVRVRECVFDALVHAFQTVDEAVDSDSEENPDADAASNESEEGETGSGTTGSKQLATVISLESLVARLFRLAASKQTLESNRDAVYEVHGALFRILSQRDPEAAAAANTLPDEEMDESAEEATTDEDATEDISEEATAAGGPKKRKKTVKAETADLGEKKKKKKNKRQLDDDTLNALLESADSDGGSRDEEPAVIQQAKKKKQKKGAPSNDEESEQLPAAEVKVKKNAVISEDEPDTVLPKGKKKQKREIVPGPTDGETRDDTSRAPIQAVKGKKKKAAASEEAAEPDRVPAKGKKKAREASSGLKEETEVIVEEQEQPPAQGKNSKKAKRKKTPAAEEPAAASKPEHDAAPDVPTVLTDSQDESLVLGREKRVVALATSVVRSVVVGAAKRKQSTPKRKATVTFEGQSQLEGGNADTRRDLDPAAVFAELKSPSPTVPSASVDGTPAKDGSTSLGPVPASGSKGAAAEAVADVTPRSTIRTRSVTTSEKKRVKFNLKANQVAEFFKGTAPLMVSSPQSRSPGPRPSPSPRAPSALSTPQGKSSAPQTTSPASTASPGNTSPTGRPRAVDFF